ncbi:MAG TPA: transposase [Anaerolineales bacterium]|nr:transposase [Anaerolineales bacterium]
MKKVNLRYYYLVFIDEAGFMMEPLVRTTWAPRGHTPVLRVADEPHGRISAIGAMTVRMKPRKFGFLFHLLPDNANFRGASVAKFLTHIKSKLNGNFTILWDSIRIHSAEPVSNFLSTNSGISIEFFPPYAPELNPVDNIWSYVKYNRLANYCPYTLIELRKRVRAEFFRLQKRPDLLEALFRHTGLDLD